MSVQVEPSNRPERKDLLRGRSPKRQEFRRKAQILSAVQVASTTEPCFVHIKHKV